MNNARYCFDLTSLVLMIKILDMWRNLMKSSNTRENGLGNFAAKRSYLGISTETIGYVATR